MKRRASIFLFLVATLATSQLFASWSSVPRDQMVSAAHVVATGRVVKISSEDKSETIMGGNRKYTHHYRLAYIEIDSILKNDLVGTGLKVGGTVVIRMAPKKPRYPNSFSFKEGDSGIWLLSYANGLLWHSSS
jgi:hypothetical protein